MIFFRVVMGCVCCFRNAKYDGTTASLMKYLIGIVNQGYTGREHNVSVRALLLWGLSEMKGMSDYYEGECEYCAGKMPYAG